MPEKKPSSDGPLGKDGERLALVLLLNREDARQVKNLLAKHGLAMVHVGRIEELEPALAGRPECLLVLDLEVAGVDNEHLRRLKRSRPDVSIIGLSAKTYHPELQESLRSHLLAVVAKPLDEEEFSCCLRGVVDLADARSAGADTCTPSTPMESLIPGQT